VMVGNNRDDIATIPTISSRALERCILDRIEPFA
jgi:hypothetical protein